MISHIGQRDRIAGAVLDGGRVNTRVCSPLCFILYQALALLYPSRGGLSVSRHI